MINEELKEKYSDELVNGINSFEENAKNPKQLETYSEKVRTSFWDDCFNLCQEEKADVEQICRFACKVIDGMSSSDNDALFKFCNQLSNISEEFAVKTLKVLQESHHSIRYLMDRSNSSYYFTNILKKHPKTFFEFSDSIINRDPWDLDVFAKVINDAPEVAPAIFSYLDNKMETANAFGEKGSRDFHYRMFDFAEKIAKKHPEFNSELQSLLHKTVEIPLGDDAHPNNYAKKFASSLLEYNIRNAFPLSELIKYQNNLVNNSGMTAGAFGALLSQIDFKERKFPKFAEQLSASTQIITEKMNSKIKNKEISAIDSLPYRWTSESLYNTIFEYAEKEIVEKKYDNIDNIASKVAENNGNDQLVVADTLNLLKLMDKVLDNASPEKFWDYSIERILGVRALQYVKSRPEAPGVIYRVLDKTISINKKNPMEYTHKMLIYYVKNDILPVADLMKFSEKVVKNHTDIDVVNREDINIDGRFFQNVLDFYQLAIDKDPSLSKRVFPLLESMIQTGMVQYDFKAKVDSIYSSIVKGSPDLVPEAIVSFSTLNRALKARELFSKLSELSKDWLDHFADEELTKEKAQKFLLFVKGLTENKGKDIGQYIQNFSTIANACKNISLLYPEYAKEALVVLNRNKSYYWYKERELISDASKEILSCNSLKNPEALSYVLNGLENNKNNLEDVLVEYVKKYPNPKEFFKILKETINLNDLDAPKAAGIFNELLSKEPDLEPEIKNLIPNIEKIALSKDAKDANDYNANINIYRLYATLFSISKDISYLNSLKNISNQKNNNSLSFFDNLVVGKILGAASTPDSARVVMGLMGENINFVNLGAGDDFINSHNAGINARENFFKSCETIINKKLLPASEVCKNMINIVDWGRGEGDFGRLCKTYRNILLTHPNLEAQILNNLTQIYNNNNFGKKELKEIVEVFKTADNTDKEKEAAKIVLTIDKKFDFLKAYINENPDSKIFYHLDSKIGAQPQYLDILFKHIDENQMFDSKIANDLIIEPFKKFAIRAKGLKNLQEEHTPDSNVFDKYEEYSYLNEPGSNLKDRSFIGKLDTINKGESPEINVESDRDIIKKIPTALFNLASAAVPYIGFAKSGGGQNEMSDAWIEIVSHFQEEKQAELYSKFEDREGLSYKFVLYMALSSPMMWEKYGKYLEDADGHKGLEHNPIDNNDLKCHNIFIEVNKAWEQYPEHGDKLEPFLRSVFDDNIIDLYIENKDLFKQLRHPVSSFDRLLKSTNSKTANFLDAFTEKMKDIAEKPEFAGNREWDCLSEAMNNNPKDFEAKAQETFNVMLEEKSIYFSRKLNSHNNVFIRNLFPKIASKVDKIAEKIGVEDIEECISYEKKYHKCAVGLYQYDKELVASLDEEDATYRNQINKKIISDMADCGVDDVFWAMNTIRVFRQINRRPGVYGSSFNNYPVKSIVPYSKVNMPVWMYQVAIDNKLPQQRMGSVTNLFDKCNAVKRAPHLASWGTEAKRLGKMPLWYQVAAGAITKKMHEGVSDYEWKHNLGLREIFWQEMKVVQDMGYVKAMQTYIEGGIEYDDDGIPKRDSKDRCIPKNIETRQAISALLENQKIEGSKENYHATMDKFIEQGVFDKMFAKEGKSKNLDSNDLLKTHKIIEMRKELQKSKSRKQKLNVIRDARSGKNTAPVADVTPTTPVENKIAAMRRELLKAKGKSL